MAYIVTAPLVITKKDDGSDLYLYEGAEVPEWVGAAEVQRLGELGFVAKVTDAQAAASTPTSESN